MFRHGQDVVFKFNRLPHAGKFIGTVQTLMGTILYGVQSGELVYFVRSSQICSVGEWDASASGEEVSNLVPLGGRS